MGHLKIGAAERGVLQLKRHLLLKEVKLNEPTMDQLVKHGVLTNDKATEMLVSFSK